LLKNEKNTFLETVTIVFFIAGQLFSFEGLDYITS